MVQSLDHPHIVKLIDWFESVHYVRVRHSYQFYLVFEEARGGELFDRLARGRLTEREACMTIETILQAIAYLHSKNMVHRDIKPENILYRTENEGADIVLVDFGIATHLCPDNDAGLHDMCGSVGYAAPEVVEKKYYGKQVDIWGLGVVTYCMCVDLLTPGFVDGLRFLRQILHCSASSSWAAKRYLWRAGHGRRFRLKRWISCAAA